MPGKATPPPACGRPLLVRGGENDCGVGCSSPPFSRRGKPLRDRDALPLLFQGGVSAKPTGWLVWIYTHTTPGLRPTPPLERRGRRRRRRDPLLLRGGENGCAV